MTGYLLDTNCISELVRPRPNQSVIDWVGSVDERILYLSVLTIGEICQGIAKLADGKRRRELQTWLEVDLRARYSGRLLAIDEAVATRWGMLCAGARQKGKPVSVVDGLLAATALQHDLTLVTRNVSDFEPMPVDVFNPWSGFMR